LVCTDGNAAASLSLLIERGRFGSSFAVAAGPDVVVMGR